MAVFLQLLGQVGSGKSFLARKLAAAKGGVVLPFAKDVYRLAQIVKGADIDKSRPQDRELLKAIGTTWGRQSREVSPDIQEKLEKHKPKEWGTPDIWANIFVSNCRNLPRGTSVFNDDTRFVNELEISTGTLGFVPVFVVCSEETRRKRLDKRGEKHDPSSTEHLSEELANFLRKKVLIRNLMPVVWSDSKASKPHVSWVYARGDFRRIVGECSSNVELATRLQWNKDRARSLISLIQESLSQPSASIYA